jgi:multimeric flavodoxin WrbA
MSQENKSVVIVNGSPKAASRSASGGLSEQAKNLFEAAGLHASVVCARSSQSQGTQSSDFAVMLNADALLLVFPLYFFCVPAMLMRFMEDYAAYIACSGGPGRTQMVYAIVNCGFPEPEINSEAIRVVKSFAGHIGAAFCFSVSIGSGSMITEAREAPFMKKAVALLDEALRHMALEISCGVCEPAGNVSISVKIPRRFYYFMGNHGWYGMARKNGLKRKELGARPYQGV